MAVDKLQELQEERMELAKQIHELADKDEMFSSEDREVWDRINKRYDENTVERAEIDDLKERVARDCELKEVMDKEASATRSSIGQERQERAVAENRESPTEVQKTRALQGYMQSINSHASEVTLQRENEKAMHLIGFDEGALSRVVSHGLTIHYGVSYRDGAGIVSSGGGHMKTDPRFKGHQTRADLGVATEPEVIPTTLQNELSRTLQAFGGFRQLARILVTSSGNNLDWAQWDDTGNPGALLAEATTFGASVAPVIAKVTFLAHKYSSTPILISAELLMDSAFDLASEIGAALGMRIGRATATAYATGVGTTEPQGVATTGGSSAGVTAASATVLTSDEHIDLQDSLDPAYRGDPSIAWAMNSTTLTELRKILQDSKYAWQPGLQAGTPDTLLGAPVAVIQEMPNTASLLIPLLYGAFRYFVIRDAGPMRMFRLEELFRQTDQTGFVAFSRHDSQTLQTSGIKRMTMAA